MKKLIFLLTIAIFPFGYLDIQAQQNQKKTRKEIRIERKAQRETRRTHNRMIRQMQNQLNFNTALQALKTNNWALQANTLFNNYGMPLSVTDNTNFITMNNNQVSVQLAFNGFNPGLNGLGGITVTGWPNNIHLRTDKRGNIIYTFNVMGAAIFAQVTIRMNNGSNYATASVESNTNGRQLTFSGNLIPYNLSNIFQSGSSF